MLTNEEFSAWCQRNKMSLETEATIQRIRTSPPSRRVRGRASNVSGRYPSVKMGCSIQFESNAELASASYWHVGSRYMGVGGTEWQEQAHTLSPHFTCTQNR